MTNIITGYDRQPLVCTIADSKKVQWATEQIALLTESETM